MVDSFIIAGKPFSSRLIVGTGKYSSPAVMVKAHEASGAEVITVAVRRVNLTDRSQQSLLDYIDTSKYFLLPNTAGCYTAEDAIRTARLGREVGLSNWVKLEVIGDERTLFPDNLALLDATRVLVAEGFVVLPYTNDDPVICRKLEEAGAAAVFRRTFGPDGEIERALRRQRYCCFVPQYAGARAGWVRFHWCLYGPRLVRARSFSDRHGKRCGPRCEGAGTSIVPRTHRNR